MITIWHRNLSSQLAWRFEVIWRTGGTFVSASPNCQGASQRSGGGKQYRRAGRGRESRGYHLAGRTLQGMHQETPKKLRS